MVTKALIPGPVPGYYSLVDWVETWKSVFIKNSLGDADDQPVLGVTVIDLVKLYCEHIKYNSFCQLLRDTFTRHLYPFLENF